jgi:diguanylate cyclase
MEYQEYKDKAAENMRLALPLMKKHSVAMTPANYAIWYEYVSGSNVALKSAIDAHFDDNDELTDQQSRELYELFFNREKDQAALLEMRQDLRRVLTEVLSFVNVGSRSAATTASNLSEILNTLNPDMSREKVHIIIEDVLSETRLSIGNTSLLTERLHLTIAEVQDLKHDLEDAKREAKTDMLTNTANRNHFDDVLLKSTRDSDSSGSELCLIFADLDFFKKINDNHGHLVGDQVLKVVAKSLKGAVKGRDLVARYGGEEFAIVLANTSLENVIKLAENIRADIASKRIQRKDTRESLGPITMSFGVARYYPTEGPESFLQRADRALYQSKRKGRNMVSEALVPPYINYP